ncbi:MAG: flagellar basal body-associated FliL family protein [Hyphomonadaceae bacterium]|nr:flagellar basal body-associated FliL family protein [Clostridia bacterium]
MKRVLIILLIVLTALIFGVVIYLYFSNANTASRPKVAAVTPKPVEKHKDTVEFSPAESFITNIKNSSKYLKVKVTLEIKGEKSKEHFEKSEAKIKDIIISVLRSKTEAQLFSDDAQGELKKAIKHALDEKLHSEDLVDLYIADFVIQ